MIATNNCGCIMGEMTMISPTNAGPVYTSPEIDPHRTSRYLRTQRCQAISGNSDNWVSIHVFLLVSLAMNDSVLPIWTLWRQSKWQTKYRDNSRQLTFQYVRDMCFLPWVYNSNAVMRKAYIYEYIYKIFAPLVIPPPNEVGGGVYWIHLVRLSVCPSVCL